MLDNSHYSKAILIAIFYHVHKRLALQLSLVFSCCYTNVPWNSSFPEPVRLWFSILLWEEFHGPILCDKHRGIVEGVQNVCSCPVLPQHFSTDVPSRTELLPPPCDKCSANRPARLPSLSCHSNSSGCPATLPLVLHTGHKPCHGDDCKYCWREPLCYHSKNACCNDRRQKRILRREPENYSNFNVR